MANLNKEKTCWHCLHSETIDRDLFCILTGKSVGTKTCDNFECDYLCENCVHYDKCERECKNKGNLIELASCIKLEDEE